jgi:hypothetical protein
VLSGGVSVDVPSGANGWVAREFGRTDSGCWTTAHVGARGLARIVRNPGLIPY